MFEVLNFKRECQCLFVLFFVFQRWGGDVLSVFWGKGGGRSRKTKSVRGYVSLSMGGGHFHVVETSMIVILWDAYLRIILFKSLYFPTNYECVSKCD